MHPNNFLGKKKFFERPGPRATRQPLQHRPQVRLPRLVAHEQVESMLDGYSAAIMAYGQTGSWKTHTLYGPDEVFIGG